MADFHPAITRHWSHQRVHAARSGISVGFSAPSRGCGWRQPAGGSTSRGKSLPSVGGSLLAGEPPPNKGRKFPAEPLTPAEVTAITGQCSRRAPTGIRIRALLTLLHRSGLRITEVLVRAVHVFAHRKHADRGGRSV
jgi:hypothetical protein